MVKREMVAVDGNEAAASVAHRVSESSRSTDHAVLQHGEFSDEWSAYGKTTCGQRPDVVEMQSRAAPPAPCTGLSRAGR